MRGQHLAALLYGLDQCCGRARFRVGNWKLGSETVLRPRVGGVGGRHRWYGLSGGFGIARGKRRCRPVGALSRVGVACGEAAFQRAGRCTYGVRRSGCALGVGRHRFQRRRPGTAWAGPPLGASAAALVRFPLGARLGRAFLRRVAPSSRSSRGGLRSMRAMLAIKSVSFRRRAETGSRGNRKGRPKTTPPRAPRWMRRRR